MYMSTMKLISSSPQKLMLAATSHEGTEHLLPSAQEARTIYCISPEDAIESMYMKKTASKYYGFFPILSFISAIKIS